MKLNELSPAFGAKHARKRVGRGGGSGKGKTAGAGHKGQRARSGVALNQFEGGQNPLYRLFPKRGFKNLFSQKYVIINTGQIQSLLDKGFLDPKQPITKETLRAAGALPKWSCSTGGKEVPLKLLAKGKLATGITIKVNKASKEALKMIEKEKGSVELISNSL